jgi:hypothetical protein
VAGKSKAGAVSVVYGTATGPGTPKYRSLTQNTSGVPGAAEAGDTFGTAVAPADLNTDGYADLVIGAPGEDTAADTNGGTMVIVWGGASGLSGTARTLVNHGSDENDRYGQALAAGDLAADGDADAAVGGTGKFSLRIVEGPYTTTGEFTGGSTSLASGVRPFDQSYGVEYLSGVDILNAGCDNLVIHGREKGTDDALTAVADTRTGNYSDPLKYQYTVGRCCRQANPVRTT